MDCFVVERRILSGGTVQQQKENPLGRHSVLMIITKSFDLLIFYFVYDNMKESFEYAGLLYEL